MKKIFALLLAVALIISIIGCSAQQASLPTDADEAVSDELTPDGETIDTEGETAEAEKTTDDLSADTVENEAEDGAGAATQANASNTAKSNNKTATKGNTTAKTEMTTKKGTTANASHTHSWKKSEKSETSTINGLKVTTTTTTYTCSCGATYTETHSGGGGSYSGTTDKNHTHSYTSSVTAKATCTDAGVKTYKCSCGSSYTESIPATGHDWKTTTKHHDAETATFDIIEAYESWYNRYWLTEWGAKNGYGNWPSDPYRYYVKFAIVKFTTYQCLEDNRSRWEKSDYEYLWYDMTESDNVININYDCYKRTGHCFVGPSSASEYAHETPSLLNWDEDRIVDKTTVIGKHTCVLKEAYDETVTTCTKCGAKK